jgi:hypothetical protein
MAVAIGVNEAIVLHRLDYWLTRSKHCFDGRYWIYNTYDAWQEQFPFWSRRTIQATFRSLERLGVVESTQVYNRSRWDKTKWYAINYGRLAEVAPLATISQPPAIEEPPPICSMAPAAPIDNPQLDPIEDATSAHSWYTKDSKNKNTSKCFKRARQGEPAEAARLLALQTTEPIVKASPNPTVPIATEGQVEPAGADPLKPVNELDAAYEAIPETERQTWYERADQALEAIGTPEWMRIAPTVKEMALRLWVGATIPGLATG